MYNAEKQNIVDSELKARSISKERQDDLDYNFLMPGKTTESSRGEGAQSHTA